MCTQPPWNKFTLPEDSLVFSTTFLSTSWAPLSVYYWTEHTIDFFLFFSWRVCIVYALVFFQLFQLSPWKTSLYSESEMCCVAMLVDSLNSIYFSDHVHFSTGLIMALLFTFLQWIQAHAHFPDFHQPKQIFFFFLYSLPNVVWLLSFTQLFNKVNGITFAWEAASCSEFDSILHAYIFSVFSPYHSFISIWIKSAPT